MSTDEFERIFPVNSSVSMNTVLINVREHSLFCFGNARVGHGSGIILGVHENENSHEVREIEVLTARHVIGKRTFNWRTLNFSGFSSRGLCSIIPGQHK